MNSFSICNVPIPIGGNPNGGIPNLFYNTCGLVLVVRERRDTRTVEQINADDAAGVSDEAIELKRLADISLLSGSIEKNELRQIELKIMKADEYFNTMVGEFRDAENEVKRDHICTMASKELLESLIRGGNCPYDYYFMRRFGLYG